MWLYDYIGKPWACPCDPPNSYTCGELVRHVLTTRAGVDVPPIIADANILREYVQDLNNPSNYDFSPLLPGDRAREMDVVFMARGNYCNHVGIAVMMDYSPHILHCMQGIGVVVHTEHEIVALGFASRKWYRHRGVVNNG